MNAFSLHLGPVHFQPGLFLFSALISLSLSDYWLLASTTLTASSVGLARRVSPNRSLRAKHQMTALQAFLLTRVPSFLPVLLLFHLLSTPDVERRSRPAHVSLRVPSWQRPASVLSAVLCFSLHPLSVTFPLSQSALQEPSRSPVWTVPLSFPLFSIHPLSLSKICVEGQEQYPPLK